ncbi:uncharacterized protein LOC135117749 [Helicoverpa armigera]|uniref:uncharacterized protein LOC135117749 n=1 Tax=Helicoverpa armigera TaxID=29058 RepID=UPI003083E24F
MRGIRHIEPRAAAHEARGVLLLRGESFPGEKQDDNKFVRLCVGPGGRPRLWVRGRSFYAAHTMRSGVVRWRCTMGGCGCKAYTQKGTLHKLVGEHNHAGRCGRRPPNIPAAQLTASISAPPSSSSSSPPTPLLVPRLPNFDPNAWIVRY